MKKIFKFITNEDSILVEKYWYEYQTMQNIFDFLLPENLTKEEQKEFLKEVIFLKTQCNIIKEEIAKKYNPFKPGIGFSYIYNFDAKGILFTEYLKYE